METYYGNETIKWLSCYKEIELLYNPVSRQHLLAIGSLYTVGSVLCIIFNTLFLAAMKRNRSLHKLSNYLLACLSCINLTTGVLIMPAASTILIGRGYHVKFCVLETYTQTVGYVLASMSFTVVFTITVDQYIAILHPFYYQNLKFRKLLVPMAAAWSVMGTACGVSWPHKQMWIYYQSFTGFTIVVTYTTVVYCYTRIFLIASKTKRKITASSISKNGKPAVRRHSNKTVVTSFSIILSFTVSYVPIAIFVIRKMLFEISATERTIIYEWFQLIALYSSVASPLVYYWRLRGVRKELYKIFKVSSTTNKISRQSVERTYGRDAVWMVENVHANNIE